MQMMDTCTFLLEMVEWLEIHLGNMGMLRISTPMLMYKCEKSVFSLFL